MQKQAFVNECEVRFMRRMNDLTDAIIKNPDERVITLSGPTCSGKTIAARYITRTVTRAGRHMLQVSIDDFYRSRELLIKEAEKQGTDPDFDSITSIDLPLLAETVRGIYEGRKVKLPVFDFVTGERTEYIPFDTSRVDVVLFEGIQAIYPEVTALLDGYPYLSVSINVRTELIINGVEFTPRELRLMRRTVRDVRTRGTLPKDTFRLWETTVLPNEEKSILPFEDSAKIKLDSTLAYEPNVIRDPLLETLAQHPVDGVYEETARSLAERVAALAPIDPEYVPEESLYSEFLGRT